MDNISNYNALVANALSEKQEVEEKISQRKDDAEQKLKEWTEPSDIVGGEMLKEGLVKTGGYGLEKIGQKYGMKGLENVGKNLQEKGIKGAVKGAIKDAKSEVKSQVESKVNQVKSQVESKVSDVKSDISEGVSEVKSKLPKPLSQEEQEQFNKLSGKKPIEGEATEEGKLAPKEVENPLDDMFEDIPKEQYSFLQRVGLQEPPKPKYIGAKSTEEQLEEEAKIAKQKITPPKKQKPQEEEAEEAEDEIKPVQTETAESVSKLFDPTAPVEGEFTGSGGYAIGAGGQKIEQGEKVVEEPKAFEEADPSDLPSLSELEKGSYTKPTEEIQQEEKTSEIATQTEEEAPKTAEPIATQTETTPSKPIETQTEPIDTKEIETQTEKQEVKGDVEKGVEGDVEKGVEKKAVEEGVATSLDETPIGWIMTAGLGLATILSPLLHHKISDKPSNVVNPSSQFGAN